MNIKKFLKTFFSWDKEFFDTVVYPKKFIEKLKKGEMKDG